MSSQFYAIDENGIKVPMDSNKSLGVIPIITATYLSFEDMSWGDIARISRRVSRSNGCYIPRLGEKKTVELIDGTLVKVSLVGLTIDYEPGFTFQITDGLDRCQFNNFMDEDLYEKLPDDLKEVVVPTSHGNAWLPAVDNILGPDIDEWYDWYEFHNTPDDRRITDSSGEFSGYWVNETDDKNEDGKITVISDNGYLIRCDSTDRYVPSVCFSVG